MIPRLLSLKGEDLEEEMVRVGVDREAIPILISKAHSLAIRIDNLTPAICNILKQVALEIGGDCAIPREAITGKIERPSCILLVNERELCKVIEKIKEQPFGMKDLAKRLEELKDKCFQNHFVLDLSGRKLFLSKRTHIMGVLNLTPDSFYDGGRYLEPERAIRQAEKMVEEGADIIDVGAESTRPGAEPIPVEEELSRLLPVLKSIKAELDIPISVDTYKSEVARRVLDMGVDIINDISGLHFDPDMAKTISKFNAGCVLMHIKGRPKDMQKHPQYTDLMTEIISYLRDSLKIAEEAGIDINKTILDPGIGFGKRIEDNPVIIRRLSELKSLGRPILIGVSRKSFIGYSLGLPVEDRLEGSLASAVLAIVNGASILRVHDVKETKRAARMADIILGRCSSS